MSFSDGVKKKLFLLQRGKRESHIEFAYACKANGINAVDEGRVHHGDGIIAALYLGC